MTGYSTPKSQDTSSINKQVRAGAICWMLAAEYYIAQIIAQAAWPSYSISRYDVSALGVTSCGNFTDPTTHETIYACSPLHAVLNAGFIILGCLIIAGAVLLRRQWPKRRLTNAGIVLVILAGVGEILAGAAPGNENVALHAIGALLHWLCGYTGMIMLGFAMMKTRRGLAIFTLLCGVIAIAGFFMYGNQVYLGLGRGGMQRVVAYPTTIWMITLGICFYPKNKINPAQGS